MRNAVTQDRIATAIPSTGNVNSRWRILRFADLLQAS